MLQVACWCDNLAWAEFCICHCANINKFCPLSGEALLVVTARVSSVEMVDLLLRYGAKIHGCGAVIAAARGGNLDTLRFLLSKDVDIHEFSLPGPFCDALSEFGSPLHAAASAGESETVEYLIRMDAKTNLRDSKDEQL